MNCEATENKRRGLTIADFDLMWAQRYLLTYLDLIKDPEGAEDPWRRILPTKDGTDLNLIDVLARSLATAIVISYSRPWSDNKDSNHQVNKLTKLIFKRMHDAGNRRGTDEPLLPFNKQIHRTVLDIRNTVVAHSDHSQWEFDISRETHETKYSSTDPFQYFSKQDAEDLLVNTQSLRSEIDHQKRALNRSA